MSDLDETFTEASDRCSLQSDTISRFIKNVQGPPRLQEKTYEDRLSLDIVPDFKNRILLSKGKLSKENVIKRGAIVPGILSETYFET